MMSLLARTHSLSADIISDSDQCAAFSASHEGLHELRAADRQRGQSTIQFGCMSLIWGYCVLSLTDRA